MAGQACKHQKDGPHTLADLQDYRTRKKPCTDEEKAESLAVNFEKIHNSVRNTTSPIEHDIGRLATLSLTMDPPAPPWTIAV